MNERAQALALDLHKGQAYYGTEGSYRREFTDFHLRPGVMAVQRLGGTSKDEAIFWLHDIIEDTDMTLDGLRHEGMPEEVVNGVDLMTWWSGRSYEEYMHRLAAVPEANRLKFVDSWRNMQATIELKNHIGPSEYETWMRRYAGNLVMLQPFLMAHGLNAEWEQFVLEQADFAKTTLDEHQAPIAEGLLATTQKPAFVS